MSKRFVSFLLALLAFGLAAAQGVLPVPELTARVIDQITVPTLILNALDDPFIRIAPDTHDKIITNPNITFLETEKGGHCAFLEQPDPSIGYDGYWAEHTLVRFILANG